MIPIEYELERMKSIVLEMMELIQAQLKNTKKALLNNDQDTALNVVKNEQRVNSLELAIDRECEDLFALQNPIATDLRFNMAMYTISGNLERIGDHAYRICMFICEDMLNVDKYMKESVDFESAFETIDSMLSIVMEALDKHTDVSLKTVFKHDKILNKINALLPETLEASYGKDGLDIQRIVVIARIVGKLERVGDLISNIAEDLIFYFDSKVVKHKGKTKRINKMLDERTKH